MPLSFDVKTGITNDRIAEFYQSEARALEEQAWINLIGPTVTSAISDLATAKRMVAEANARGYA